MTSWVCTEILTRDTPAARAMVIEHFVQIALHCYKHNDMHCALNITVALASSSIKGLSKTWEEVDKKVSRWENKFVPQLIISWFVQLHSSLLSTWGHLASK